MNPIAISSRQDDTVHTALFDLSIRLPLLVAVVMGLIAEAEKPRPRLQRFSDNVRYKRNKHFFLSWDSISLREVANLAKTSV